MVLVPVKARALAAVGTAAGATGGTAPGGTAAGVGVTAANFTTPSTEAAGGVGGVGGTGVMTAGAGHSSAVPCPARAWALVWMTTTLPCGPAWWQIVTLGWGPRSPFTRSVPWRLGGSAQAAPAPTPATSRLNDTSAPRRLSRVSAMAPSFL